MLNTLLALFAALTVIAAHGAYKLVRLPFRLLRGLFRHSSKPTQLTTR